MTKFEYCHFCQRHVTDSSFRSETKLKPDKQKANKHQKWI